MSSTVEATTQQLDALRTEQSAVVDRIRTLADRAASGDADGAGELPALAKQQAELRWQIEQVETELQEQQARQHERDHAARTQRFDACIAEAQAARTEFNTLFRRTSLALGTYCARVEEATRLANSLRGQGLIGVFPHHANAVKELGLGMDPYEGFDAEPVLGFGYNYRAPAITAYKERNAK
jgi:chromosome segregation ATPase